jgi:aspartyl-tRNA(Asn)/glutamyl-tRNA(Gln) amidotransferase subunit A
VVRRLEDAGAVIVTRTGLHEFAYGFNSENEWFGPVRNPLDQSLSPGGSSGGSAAAVAAEQVPIAIGTDTGGSVRVPAALCGVYGLKVTHGRVPLTGVFPLAASLDTVGPLAATVDDLSLTYQTIAGHDPSDRWSVDQPVVRSGGARPDLGGLRVGLPVAWLDQAHVTDAVADAFAVAVAGIRGLGATVEELDDPALCPPGSTAELAGGEIAAVHRTWRSEGLQYGSEISGRLEVAFQVTLDQYVEATHWRAAIRQRAAAALSRFDVLVTPTTGTTRKIIGDEMVETSDGAHHHRGVLSWFTALVNVAGLPAIAAPLAAESTPPPSLQIIGPWWGEHRLLEVAATLEREGITR